MSLGCSDKTNKTARARLLRFVNLREKFYLYAPDVFNYHSASRAKTRRFGLEVCRIR